MLSGQKYAETTRGCPRVASLLLCNSFTDTAIFRYNDEASTLWLLPSPALKRMVMSGLQMSSTDSKISEAREFILERLENLGHSDLASRLTLSSLKGFVEPQNVNDLPVTIIDVFDECSLTQVTLALPTIASLMVNDVAGCSRRDLQVLPECQVGPSENRWQLPLLVSH